MKVDEFIEFQKRTTAERMDIMVNKGREYTKGDTDKLANFKEVAAQLKQDPLTVWAVYFAKHIASIMSYVQNRQVYSESIESRFFDALNYLDLGLALISEARGQNEAIKEAYDKAKSLPF